ncbi:MAG TPA: hypothetical protein VFV33_02495, partial [Gemmatimonadaceae bacterium]|nr:hypothetical protein [Gemmatimonadaceae bacterium]
YLGVNPGGYSLASYAAGDRTFTFDLPDNAGLALFSTADPASFDAAHRLDAVGFNTMPGASAGIYREGTGLTPFGGADAEYCYLRRLPSGTPQDTGDNARDFIVVSTQAETYGEGLQATLGAPGPENSSAPVPRNAEFRSALLDATAPQHAPPNRVRGFESDPANNATFGTLSVRRRVTNMTGASVTRLRFRVTIVSGFPVPDASNADLRPRSSTDVVVTLHDAAQCAPAAAPCDVTVKGTTLEQPPAQPNGGGLNSSLSAGAVSLNSPLAHGESLNVQFLLGIQRTGRFRFYVNIEALP